MSKHGRACVVVAVVSGFAAATAAWWLIGDLSARVRQADDLGYVNQAPNVPSSVVTIVGVLGLVVVLVTLIVAIVAAWRHAIEARSLRLIVAAVPLGWLLAAIARILSAGSVGSNIGAGIAMLVGGFIVFRVVVWARAESSRLLDTAPGNASPPT